MAILRCKTSFHAVGRPVMVRAGQIFDSSDPVVEGREHLFEDVDGLVERSTANPGERRFVKRAAKRTTAKPTEV
jgi:hypothetical protein